MRIPRWLLRQTVSVERYRGSGAYGPVYDPPVDIRCRIEPKRQLVRDREGNEVVAEARLFAEPTVELGPEDRVTWDGRAYTVIEARKVYGLREPSHVEAVLR